MHYNAFILLVLFLSFFNLPIVSYDLNQANVNVWLSAAAYCDKESYEQINKIRPDYLKERTHYIICDFEEFQMVINGKTFKEYREQIKENRINNIHYHTNTIQQPYKSRTQTIQKPYTNTCTNHTEVIINHKAIINKS